MRSCWSYLTAAAVTSSSFFVADAKLYNEIYIEFGANLGDTIPSRLRNFFGGIPEIIVKEYSADMEESLGSNSLVLSFGDTQLSQTYASIASVNSEGYHLSVSNYLSNSTLLAVNGQPIDSKDRKFALDINKVHYGAAIGSYAALEMLGFSFLHPLQPYVPSNLSLNEVTDDDSVSKIEEPYWEKRTWHIHTMHPLEFTEVLNGYDIPMFVNFDQEDFKCPLDTHCESWESMYENLPGVFDWLLANKQNRVEVLLLGNEKWDNYDDLTTGVKRQDRLRKINDLAHEFGLLMGADIPIALMQQHGWAMVQVRDDFEKQKQDIIERVGWAFNANYDFITTESGLSEFTKPSCDLMLDLFEVYIKEVVDTWGREAMTKVHCSTDQYCTDQDEATGAYKYTDPRTGEPINFNFLPTYASNGLGVLTHTVQVYSFDDPTAGAYGNDNFTYMSDYMNYEASLKKRDVLYYGETAYWVNVDVDVPLFLPLSGQRRLADLRQTARLETKGNYKISGQMNFESGWEFGYYISNVVCARAAWNPMMTEEDEWIAFEQILAPALSVFGEHRDEIIGAIVNLAKDQAEILIFGRINGRESADLTKLSGHAYMSGSDTWVDLPRLLGLSFTQPDKVHVDEPNDPLWNEAREMLAELKTIFTKHSTIFQNVLTRAKDSLDPVGLKYLEEIVDSVELLRLRATFNDLLYTAQDPKHEPLRSKYLLDSRQVLKEASSVMTRRVDNFRVPSERIAGWRHGPTTYPFGYVWSAKTLYFWWRDQGIAESKSTVATSACYLNREQPIELVVGKGKLVEQAIRLSLKKKGKDANETTVAELIADCLAPPLREFQFPRDL